MCDVILGVPGCVTKCDKGRGSKLAKNSVTYFMDGPCGEVSGRSCLPQPCINTRFPIEVNGMWCRDYSRWDKPSKGVYRGREANWSARWESESVKGLREIWRNKAKLGFRIKWFENSGGATPRACEGICPGRLAEIPLPLLPPLQ